MNTLYRRMRLWEFNDRYVVEPTDGSSGSGSCLSVSHLDGASITLLDEVPKSSDGARPPKVETIFGVVGILKLFAGSYLFVITERECAGTYMGHPIFKVSKLKVYSCDSSVKKSPEQQVNTLGATFGSGAGAYHIFDVKSFGASADGLTDDTYAFKAAWQQACNYTGKPIIVVPKGVYLIGPIRFSGPCRYSSSLVLNIKMVARWAGWVSGHMGWQGYLKATTDLSRYKHNGGGWLEFRLMKGLILRGGGTLDGQGLAAWPFNDCSVNSNCQLLPMNLKFVGMNKTVIRNITSLNSKFFHIALVGCRNFKGSHLNISAPETSPNTDGIHIERSSSVYFSSSFIGSGDDCISVGLGNSHVTITSITCGPGHGISVGSLGKYPNENTLQ